MLSMLVVPSLDRFLHDRTDLLESQTHGINHGPNDEATRSIYLKFFIKTQSQYFELGLCLLVCMPILEISLEFKKQIFQAE